MGTFLYTINSRDFKSELFYYTKKFKVFLLFLKHGRDRAVLRLDDSKILFLVIVMFAEHKQNKN